MAEGGVAPIECDVMLIQFECSIKIPARYEAEASNEGRFLADTPQTPGKYSTQKFTNFRPFSRNDVTLGLRFRWFLDAISCLDEYPSRPSSSSLMSH